MNKITNPLSKLTKKTKITIIIITIILLGVTVLYQTFAISSNISGNNDNYTVTLNTDSIVKVPSNSNKTVYFKIRNNNKGTVKYGVGYKGTNIVVKVYSDSESPNTGTISESESKFIKLYIENTSSSESSVSLISVLGYENGGDLIPKEGYTLVTEIKSVPINLAKHITNLYSTATKTEVINNEITYNYATSVSLMNDRKGSMSVGIDSGNIRYYGTNSKLVTVPAYMSDDTFSLIGKSNSEDECLEVLNQLNICNPEVDGYDNYGFSDQDTCETEYDWGSYMGIDSMTYKEGKLKYCSGTGKQYNATDINNYIYFNCSDYSNQSDSTCEKWRIIGVFDGKVKIMRGSTIGSYSWDTSDSNTNSGYGVNEWSDADLMKLLNSGYDSLSVGGSLYWNSKSGTCYNATKNATTSCDFTNTGLKNDITRNLIAEVTYNLGGWSSSNIYSNQIYGYERGTTVYTGREATWTGKVAIPYPSDYGYAADLNLCNQTLYNYDNSTCTANNWITNIITNNGSSYGWLLTPFSGRADIAWYVNSGGVVYDDDACSAGGVAPVLSLSSELDIGSGTGMENNPYQLSV